VPNEAGCKPSGWHTRRTGRRRRGADRRRGPAVGRPAGRCADRELLAAYRDLRWAVRAVVWRHPAWDVDELVFYTRRDGLIFPDVSSIGLPWVGSPGGDLHVLTVDRTGRTFGTRRPLLNDRLAPGHVRGFDLHFDARRLVFAWTHSDKDFSQHPVRPGHETFKQMGSGWIYELCLDSDTCGRSPAAVGP
jgi:hypothetical protein